MLVTLEELRNFAVSHGETSFTLLVTAAINNEPWAVERLNFALGCISTIVPADGNPDEVKLAIIQNIRTERPGASCKIEEDDT
jgi:hypothetical protein